MTRRALLSTVVVLAVGAVGAGVLWWSPWDPAPPREVRAAADDAATVPGVTAVETEWWEVEGGPGSGSLTVHLDPGLAPAAAQDAADAASAATRLPDWVAAPPTVYLWVVAGEPDAAGTYPVSLRSPDDGEVELAYRLLAAGATTVDDATVIVPASADLPVVADVLAGSDLFTVPSTLRTPDDAVVYDAGLVPRTATAELVADVAARPDVTSVRFTWNQVEPSVLDVVAASTSVAESLADWLAAQDVDAVVTAAEADITVPGDDPVHVWIAGTEPTPIVPHAVRLPDEVQAWPADPDAPACTGGDLALTLTTPDAAAGQRYLAVRARNVSAVPCAVEGVPQIDYLNADDAPQEDVRTVAASAGVVPGRVVVPVGEQVIATMQWGAMSTANDPDATVALDVVPVAGAEPVRLSPEIPVGAGLSAGATTLDVLDGAEVRVSPWVQAAEGWAVP